jgi:hypothetical protein
MGEILTYLGYLLVLALLFAIAAAIGYVGLSLRRGVRSARRGSLLIGLTGLMVLGVVGVALVRMNDSPVGAVIYGVIVVLLLGLGWSGRLIVPEGLGDD